jgi:hypothetical protein
VLNRIAAMNRLAQARAASGPVEARSSYATAAGLLGELSRGTVGNSSPRSGAQLHRSAAPSRGGSATAAAVPSSERMLSDIRALRAAAQNARRNGSASEAARLDRMAQQYAAASKAFFTAQLREALFAPAGSSGTIVIDNGDGNRAVPATGGRPRGAAGTVPAEPPAVLPAENTNPGLGDADADAPPAAPPVDTVPAPPAQRAADGAPGGPARQSAERTADGAACGAAGRSPGRAAEQRAPAARPGPAASAHAPASARRPNGSGRPAAAAAGAAACRPGSGLVAAKREGKGPSADGPFPSRSDARPDMCKGARAAWPGRLLSLPVNRARV